MPEPLICDVCAAEPKGLWFYPHAAYEVRGVFSDVTEIKVVEVQRGDWAVCDDCAALVEAHDVIGMVQRACQFVSKPDRQLDARLAKALYDGFFNNRRGSATYSETRLNPERRL